MAMVRRRRRRVLAMVMGRRRRGRRRSGCWRVLRGAACPAGGGRQRAGALPPTCGSSGRVRELSHPDPAHHPAPRAERRAPRSEEQPGGERAVEGG
eukprot:256103-Rhodomonas_salina.2